MISRRLYRIKLLQALYSHFQSGKTLSESEKELQFSISKTYDLFFYIILLILDVGDYAESRIELRKQKRVPTEDDLNPNKKFVDNRILSFLRKNLQVDKYVHTKKMSWVNYPELIKELYEQLENQEFFKDYMDSEKEDIEEDKRLIVGFLSDILAENDSFYQNLEEQSVFWNAEIEFVISMLIKVVKGIKDSTTDNTQIVDVLGEKEDREFVKKLFRSTIINFDEYKKEIDQFTKNWDVERIAFMDIVIMQLAINEIIEFPSIPKKVSFNEYIEIAKGFSTRNSAQFVNGILDKIVAKLESENRINKKGRGLI